MKGKIDKYGNLHIGRGVRGLTPQECFKTPGSVNKGERHSHGHDIMCMEPCGRYGRCPEFREPESNELITFVQFCGGILNFTDFTDERLGGNDEKASSSHE